MKILSSFTHPHFIPNLCDLILLWNIKDNILSVFFVHTMEVSGDQLFVFQHSSTYLLCFKEERKFLERHEGRYYKWCQNFILVDFSLCYIISMDMLTQLTVEYGKGNVHFHTHSYVHWHPLSHKDRRHIELWHMTVSFLGFFFPLTSNAPTASICKIQTHPFSGVCVPSLICHGLFT